MTEAVHTNRPSSHCKGGSTVGSKDRTHFPGAADRTCTGCSRHGDDVQVVGDGWMFERIRAAERDGTEVGALQGQRGGLEPGTGARH
jgi:hypothetical protein